MGGYCVVAQHVCFINIHTYIPTTTTQTTLHLVACCVKWYTAHTPLLVHRCCEVIHVVKHMLTMLLMVNMVNMVNIMMGDAPQIIRCCQPTSIHTGYTPNTSSSTTAGLHVIMLTIIMLTDITTVAKMMGCTHGCDGNTRHCIAWVPNTHHFGWESTWHTPSQPWIPLLL